MLGDEILVDHLAHDLRSERFDLHDLVRGAETVEEVEERDPGLEGGGVGDEGHVLGFLDGAPS